MLPNEIPVVVALFLALGALRLARMGVLARWPAAVESLGSATVLAVDKTGTLTANRMAVERLLTWPAREAWSAGEPLEEPVHALLELAVLASREDPVDAMERAIVQLAVERLEGSEHLHPDWPLRREYPLQPDLLVSPSSGRTRRVAGAWPPRGPPRRSRSCVISMPHPGGGWKRPPPALRAADIGVAMGRRGSAVAREAADLVLLDDTFASLVRALELGRRVDANLHRALGYTLAVHLPIAALSLLPLLVVGQGLILLPAHIALLHLVIDPACTVVFEALPGGPRLLRQPHRDPEAPLFGPETWHRSLLQGP